MDKKIQIANLKFGLMTCVSILFASPVLADTPKQNIKKISQDISKLLRPSTDESYRTFDLSQLESIEFNPQAQTPSLPVVGANTSTVGTAAQTTSSTWIQPATTQSLTIENAVNMAIQRHPTIAQSIASLSGQNANIDVAKSAYYPQLSGQIRTGDVTSNQRGTQVFAVDATQMVYDFGKVKNSVDIEKTRLNFQQAAVLISIDDIAEQTARAVINTLRFQRLVSIYQAQMKGLQRLYTIAKLRSDAGISSLADPVQAQAYLENAQSALIIQESNLKQQQEKLRTLLGQDPSRFSWIMPEQLVNQSNLYDTPDLQYIPEMISAQAEIALAREQRKQNNLSRYPTLSLVGSLTQAINGQNPNNGKDDGFDSAISLSASSNFYQGGATGSRDRAASFAEQAARDRLNATYLEINDAMRNYREQIQNTERQILVLKEREKSSALTRELYEEQYKLGKRSILDLLSSEQMFYVAQMERENARFDIFENMIRYIDVTGRNRDVYGLNNIIIQGFEVKP